MSASSDPRSVPALISDLATQVTTLMRTEMRLLRAEISEKLGHLAGEAAEVAAGAICMLAALLILLQALVVAVAHIGHMGIGWASLIVGLVVAIIAAVLVRTGTKNIEDMNLTPQRTQEQLKRDAVAAKEQIS